MALRVTGLDRNTIAPLRKLRGHDRLAPGRIRHAGTCAADRGLRPGVLRALDRLLHDATAGDPMTGLLSTRRFDAETGQGPAPPGDQSISRHHRAVLHDAGFSLRTNRKQLAEVTDPDRDRQFRYLTRFQGFT